MKKIILLFVTALILSGCNTGDGTVSSDNITPEENYSFTGSNENWEVLFEVDVVNKDQGENQVDENGTLTFIGEDEAPKMVDYKLKTGSGVNSNEGTSVPIYDEVGSFAQGSCGNCVPMEADEELELEIIWDGIQKK
ncbi:membrane lipoprotein lipid attachment site-containing protein [Planococcus kocurii]|uniref:membrane lipoprotein lipid attachment site-containing protein n=1 Tax=Planococcus TaxID=1372 RepID=UPI0011EE3F8C|nr:membrane lipoprotein lipid attachment site-containing protein [Planococcus sp. ANT_H30]KAA0957583.1 hypothetical protein FQ085_05865 [Planococcus sp. ANT_H30]